MGAPLRISYTLQIRYTDRFCILLSPVLLLQQTTNKYWWSQGFLAKYLILWWCVMREMLLGPQVSSGAVVFWSSQNETWCLTWLWKSVSPIHHPDFGCLTWLRGVLKSQNTTHIIILTLALQICEIQHTNAYGHHLHNNSCHWRGEGQTDRTLMACARQVLESAFSVGKRNLVSGIL